MNRRKIVVLGVPALLALLLLPSLIQLNGYRKRVAAALGNALGRNVEVGDVSVRLLPWPAIVAENVVVGELPAIGAEPFARMSELRATPRLFSLWSGHPKFSSVVFVEPSVNVSRAHFAASTTPPVVPGASEPVTPREFPYIEFKDGRINFKNGDLKSVVFFSEVKGTLYRDGDRLQVSFTGKPSRTDRALSGAGEVRVEGQLAPNLELNARLIDAFLSDFLALGTGVQPGIQGKLAVEMRVNGRAAALRLEGRAQLNELHRSDGLPPLANTPLRMNFTGSADLPARRLDLAELRSEGGTIAAFGNMRGFLAEGRPFEWDLQLRLAEAEARGWIAGLQQFTPRVARDLTGSGTMDGAVHFKQDKDGLSADGAIDIQDLTIESATLPPTTASSARIEFDGPILRVPPVAIAPEGAHAITLGLSCDWTTPVAGPRTLQASAVGQDVSLGYLSPLAAAFGLPGLPNQGVVSVNAKLAKERGEAPAFSGAVSVSKVRWTPAWLAVPVMIHTARVDMSPKRVRASGLVIEAGDSTITGTLERNMERADNAAWQADLRFSELGSGRVVALFAGKPVPESIANLRGGGKIAATHFHLLQRSMMLEEFESAFTLDPRHIVLRDARAKLADGRVTGKVDIHWEEGREPEYEAQAKMVDAQIEKLAPDLADGVLSGTMLIKAQGHTAADLAASLDLKGWFTARALRIANDSLAEALQIDQAPSAAADVEVRDRVLHFTRLSIAGPPALNATGTVNFNRDLDFDFRTFRLSGTLADPRRLKIEGKSQ